MLTGKLKGKILQQDQGVEVQDSLQSKTPDQDCLRLLQNKISQEYNNPQQSSL